MEKNNKFIFKVSDSFEETVILKALQIVKEGGDQGEVDNEHFGQLGIFINRRPDNVMLVYQGMTKSPLEGKTIYIGGNETEA